MPMALMDFVRKQFIDIIEWTEGDDGTLAWRFPMADREIQHGASLTVRESQLALFVDEGRIADVFGPGRYRLGTRTLPVLTYLKNWDKLFESPFKSDVYFFSTRQQLDRRWGTTQPVTVRDKDFGAVRLRAFGNCAYRIADATRFHAEVSGTREAFGVDDLDGPLRALMLQHLADAVAQSGVPFLDLAASQAEFAKRLHEATAPEFARLGLALEAVTVQSLSLPEELQKLLDQRIGMGMVGDDMSRFLQYQTAQAIPGLAQGGGSGGGSVVGDAMGLGAGVALGQVMAQQLAQGLQPPASALTPGAVMATIEQLAALKAQGILTDAEFSAKKTELLKKIG
jgi:membrane protease subunit (stomatin/prohibitin family)